MATIELTPCLTLLRCDGYDAAHAVVVNFAVVTQRWICVTGRQRGVSTGGGRRRNRSRPGVDGRCSSAQQTARGTVIVKAAHDRLAAERDGARRGGGSSGGTVSGALARGSDSIAAQVVSTSAADVLPVVADCALRSACTDGVRSGAWRVR